MRIPITLNTRAFFLLFGGIFLCAGTSLLYGGITTASREQAYAKRGEAVEAVVTSKSIQRASREGNTSTRYEIAYRFTTPDGPVEGATAVPVEEWEALEPGRPFTITHLPGTPGSSRAQGAGGLTEAVVMMVAGALAALFGGIVFTLSARHIWREWRLLREGLAAQGTVLAVEPSNVAVNRVRQWQVRYRYQDHIGRSHEGSTGALSPEEAHTLGVGDPLTVRFDRHRPGESAWERPHAAGAGTSLWPRVVGFARRIGALLLIFVIFAVAMVLGEAVPALKDLEQLLARHESLLLAITIGMAAVGFALFMGSIVVRIFGSATDPLTATEVEDLSRSVNMEARPVFGRVTRYRFRGRSAGSSFSERFTLREAKAAWRQGTWRADSRWRSNFVVMLGVMLLTVGLFGTFIVVGPNGVKLLCAAALAYAAGRTVAALIRA
jgi:hypothetical protein